MKNLGLSGAVYLNVGHSNYCPVLFRSLQVNRVKIATFFHDLIPLEFPEFQTERSTKRFREKFETAKFHADIILTNSQDTRARIVDRMDRNIPITAAYLGVDTKSQKTSSLPTRPYFICLGTIEPRKNHALLLDVWERHKMAADLYIVGQRGWGNENVFRRLDALDKSGPIFEMPSLSDQDMWPLLQGARALLFPSFAEGFGLPTLEAASLGVPVICGDLAINRELLGAYPVYADTRDLYRWASEIETAAGANRVDTKGPLPHIPSWAEHFAIVDRSLASILE